MDDTLAKAVGVPNEATTHWGLMRSSPDGHTWQRCEAQVDGLMLREFPLSELSLDAIKRNWGPGKYRVQWFSVDPQNPDARRRRKPQGAGTIFQIGAPAAEELPHVAAVAAPPPAPPPPPAEDPVARSLAFAERMMVMSDQRSAQQVQSIAMLAGATHGGAAPVAGGIDRETLALHLRVALADQVAPLAARVAELEKRVEDLEAAAGDDDATPAPAAAAMPPWLALLMTQPELLGRAMEALRAFAAAPPPAPAAPPPPSATQPAPALRQVGER